MRRLSREPHRRRPGPHARLPIATGWMVATGEPSLVGVVGFAARPRRNGTVRIPHYPFNSTGSWSILAARMKSFSDRPPRAWVESSIATFR